MIRFRCAAFAAFALTASLACAQTVERPTEVPVPPGVNAPPPAIWGSMNAFDLKRRAWRENRPEVTIDSGYAEQKQRQRDASLQRERIRYAERLRDTQHAGTPPSASIGAGERTAPAE
jgi:hypothetical protein